MKRYRGNQTVHSDIYLNPQEISFKSLERRGCFPGPEREGYLRVPTPALLFAGPIAGGVYAILLPHIDLGMLAWLAVGKIVELAGNAAEATARMLRPAREPGRASQSRGRPDKHAKKKDRDRWAERVRRKLQ
jgi:hypothetical protein